MASPTLAILPLFWALWTFMGVLTTFTMTIVQGHYRTGIISISDTGADYPESIVLTIVSTVSSLLEAGIVYIVYKSLEIQALKRSFCGVTYRTWLLTFGWMMCIGNLITPFLQSSRMTLTILEWIVLFCSCISQILVYWDFPGSYYDIQEQHDGSQERPQSGSIDSVSMK